MHRILDLLCRDVHPIALGQPIPDVCLRIILSYGPINPARTKIEIKIRSDDAVSYGDGVLKLGDLADIPCPSYGLNRIRW